MFATSINFLYLFQVSCPWIFSASNTHQALALAWQWLGCALCACGRGQEEMSVSHWAWLHRSFAVPDSGDSAGNTPRQMGFCFHGTILLPTNICASLQSAHGKVSQCGQSKRL